MSKQDIVVPRTSSPPTPTRLRLRPSRCVNSDRSKTKGYGASLVTAAEAGLEGVSSARSGCLGRYGHFVNELVKSDWFHPHHLIHRVSSSRSKSRGRRHKGVFYYGKEKQILRSVRQCRKKCMVGRGIIFRAPCSAWFLDPY